MSETFIHRLPVELLTDIFDACVPRKRFGFDGGTRHTYQYLFHNTVAPFTLISVCRLWRTVAFNTPGLWDTVHVGYGQSIADVRRWLSVRPQQPFHLMLPTTGAMNEQHEAHLRESWKLLEPTQHQWKSLTVSVEECWASDFIAFLQQTDFSKLRFTLLDIQFRQFRGDNFEKSVTTILPYLHTIPSVKDFGLGFSDTCYLKLDEMDVPWSRYRTVELLERSPSPDIRDKALCLSKCTSATMIKSFDMNARIDNSIPAPYEPLYTLSLLTTLVLSRGDDALNLLLYFDLPKLRILTIDVNQRNHAALESFISRTPSLYSLSIEESTTQDGGFVRVTDEDIVEWLCSPYLRSVPCFGLHLNSSSISRGDISKNVVRIIKSYSRHGVVFPGPLMSFKRQGFGHVPKEYSYVHVGWTKSLEDLRGLLWIYQDGVFNVRK